MTKVIITTIGMGKSSYTKTQNSNEEVGYGRYVDLDFKCPFKALDNNVKTSVGNLTNALVKSGKVDCIFVNPEFINLDALTPGLAEVICLYPSNTEDVKERTRKRDGDDTFANMIEDQINTMASMAKANVVRLGITEAYADGVTEYLNAADSATEKEDLVKSDVTNQTEGETEKFDMEVENETSIDDGSRAEVNSEQSGEHNAAGAACAEANDDKSDSESVSASSDDDRGKSSDNRSADEKEIGEKNHAAET